MQKLASEKHKHIKREFKMGHYNKWGNNFCIINEQAAYSS